MAQLMAERSDGPGKVLVEADDLAVHFPIYSGLLRREVGRVKAVDGATFAIRRGETLGLVGESGSGKSTTGRALIRLREPTGGSVRYDGRDMSQLSGPELRRLRRRVQIVFQDPYASLNPRMSIGSIIAEPITTHGVARGSAVDRRVIELLEQVGLSPDHRARYPHEFSGGQRQRIGIARALAVEPEFIVCDEPISSLDVSIAAQVLNLLVELRERLGLTYLFIAHDLSSVKYISDRVAVMYLGRIVEIGRVVDVYSSPAHPYTVALLNAVPIPDPPAERQRRRHRLILRGDIPSPANPPSGCRFHTRCWLYDRLGKPAICRTSDPPQQPLRQSHTVACHFTHEVEGARIPSPLPLVEPAGDAGADRTSS
jgi:oligopeptide transport system ATP-binding protein